MEVVRKVFNGVVHILPSFNITDKSVLPYGLKPHTRSVYWIVEQVIVQQTKYHRKEIGIDDLDFHWPDTCLHDCLIHIRKQELFVNVKISDVRKKPSKNDIAAVEKLFYWYTRDPSYDLIYACFGIAFKPPVTIEFVPGYLQVFSPQFLPIYVNPRNDKIQALYEHKPIYRTRKAFLNLLKKASHSIPLEDENE